jgi:hypothetical protein
MPPVNTAEPPPAPTPISDNAFFDALDAKFAFLNDDPAPAGAEPIVPADTVPPASGDTLPAGDDTVTPTDTVPAGDDTVAPTDTLDSLFKEDTVPGNTDDVVDPAEEAEIAEQTKGMSSKAAKAFRSLKQDLKAERARLKVVESQLKEKDDLLRKQHADPESINIEQLQARVAELENEAALFSIESTSKYKTEVSAPLENAHAGLLELVERYEIDPKEAGSIIHNFDDPKEQGKQLSRLLADLPERDRMKFYKLVDDVAAIHEVEVELKKNAKENLQKALADEDLQRRSRTEAQVKEYKISRQQVLEKLTKHVDGVFPSEFLSKVSTDYLDETKFSTEPSMEAQAFSVYAAMVLPELIRQYRAEKTRVAELEKATQRLKGAAPKAGNGSPTPHAPAKEMSFVEALERRM